MTFEENIQKDLHRYLMMVGQLDQMLPDAPDIEGKWESVAKAYLPDGLREFTGYPTVSLGWMMYVGMAVAQMWDKDWAFYTSKKVHNLYTYLRDKRGYDHMDEYIREEILNLTGSDYTTTEKLVAECASRTNSQMHHAGLEPGTKSAFQGYVSCLHQLYLMGAAIQLKRLGYKMTKLS